MCVYFSETPRASLRGVAGFLTHQGSGHLVALHAVDLLLVGAAARLAVEEGQAAGAVEAVGHPVLAPQERHAAAAVVVVAEGGGAKLLLLSSRVVNCSDQRRRCVVQKENTVVS